MANTPPELTTYAANGYNAKDGNFLGAPIFALTYTKGNTVNWGSGGNRDIPDQLSASAATTAYTTSRTVLMETTADYDRAYSVSVAAEFAGVSYNGSVNSSLLFHGDLFTDTSSTYALNQNLQTVLSFERLNFTADGLSKEFVDALLQLPQTVGSSDTSDDQKYFDFFDEYGTHYLESGTMGGIIVMQTAIDDAVFQNATALEVAAGVSAGYEGMIGSGSLNVETAFQSSTFLSSHSNSVHINTSTLGGLSAPDSTISAWQQTLYNSPIVLLNVPAQGGALLSDLRCISELVAIAGAPQVIATNIETMLQAYMTSLSAADGLLTSPIDIAPGIVTTLNGGDGFVLASLKMTINGDRSWIQGFEDFAADPVTQRACASQHYFTINRDHEIGSASFLMPTPQGSTYFNLNTITAGQPSLTLKFMGLGSVGDQLLGSWTSSQIPENVPLTAPSDGFVLAFVDAITIDGARSYVQGTQPVNGTNTIVAGASQHYFTVDDIQVPFNSFTMPVPRNTQYQVNFVQTALNPVSAAYFLPLDGSSVTFGGFQTRQAGRVYQATTDGFLVAYLFMTADGDRAAIDLYSNPDQTTLIQEPPLASTSIHSFVLTDTYVPYNTATIPVPRNNYYTVNIVSQAGSPGLSLLWIPLVPATGTASG